MQWTKEAVVLSYICVGCAGWKPSEIDSCKTLADGFQRGIYSSEQKMRDLKSVTGTN